MDKLEEALAYGLKCIGKTDITIKQFQRDVITGYLKGNDVFCTAPTGQGKSITYELAPFCIEYMQKTNFNQEDQSQNKVAHIVIIIQPLIALMKEQVALLKARGLKALYLGDKEKTNDKEIYMDSNYIFGAPESFTGQFMYLFRNEEFLDKLKLIVIDESHCIHKL